MAQHRSCESTVDNDGRIGRDAECNHEIRGCAAPGKTSRTGSKRNASHCDVKRFCRFDAREAARLVRPV